MLTKLIKQEFRATSRIMLPLAAAVLLLAGLAGYSAIMLNGEVDYKILDVLFLIILVGFFFSLFGICAVCFILMIQRFYKNLLGQEGYLMFTLPVSVDALVWAKLIVSCVWFVVTGVAVMLAMILMGVVSAAFAFDAETISRLWGGFTDLVKLIGGGHIAGYALELVVVFFVASCTTCLQFYLAMAIGQCFANRKIFWSVVSFFAVSILMSMLTTLGGSFLVLFDMNTVLDSLFSGMPNIAAAKASAHLVFVCMAALSAVHGAIYYIPTTLLLKKKLNLA